jgi:hypothetical protein
VLVSHNVATAILSIILALAVHASAYAKTIESPPRHR